MAEAAGADLHLHSTASDGLLAPGEVAAAAAQAGLAAAALTDHDTTAGFAEFALAAGRLGLWPVCGAEVAALCCGEEVHLLSYFAAPPADVFARLLGRLAAERRGRAAEMLERLRAIGIDLPQSVLAHPLVGRPHVARALVEAGAAGGADEAFARFLLPGRPGYVGRYRPPADEVIARAHAEGGVVALAHPVRCERDLVADLAGLDALEVRHPSADAAARRRLGQVARRRGLIATGGSDFHGKPGEALRPEDTTSPQALRLLRSRIGMSDPGQV